MHPGQQLGLVFESLEGHGVLIESVTGWLADKYGLSWQIVPVQLKEMMSDPDQTKSKRVSDAMLKMKKIDIAELKKAYDG